MFFYSTGWWIGQLFVGSSGNFHAFCCRVTSSYSIIHASWAANSSGPTLVDWKFSNLASVNCLVRSRSFDPMCSSCPNRSNLSLIDPLWYDFLVDPSFTTTSSFSSALGADLCTFSHRITAYLAWFRTHQFAKIFDASTFLVEFGFVHRSCSSDQVGSDAYLGARRVVTRFSSWGRLWPCSFSILVGFGLYRWPVCRWW